MFAWADEHVPCVCRFRGMWMNGLIALCVMFGPLAKGLHSFDMPSCGPFQAADFVANRLSFATEAVAGSVLCGQVSRPCLLMPPFRA